VVSQTLQKRMCISKMRVVSPVPVMSIHSISYSTTTFTHVSQKNLFQIIVNL
jgi:surface polysaccharide O-acyltransferase-like enzyme